MRSISAFLGLLVVSSSIAACGQVLGIEPWEEPALKGGSSSSSAGGMSGETSSSDSSASSGSVDPCSNGVQDGSESGVDCGGGTCEPCFAAQGCLVDSDCASDYCPASRGYCIEADGRAACGVVVDENPTCGDCIKNGTETDIDCGGDCFPCRVGKGCTNDGECWSGVCTNAKCASGAANTRCFSGSDCMSGVCAAATLMSECAFDNCCQ